MRAAGGAWSAFVDDLVWSADACSTAPLVTSLWLVSSLLPLVTGPGPVGVLLLPVLLFFVGFPGTVRLSFARQRTGSPPLRPAEVFAASWRYLARFVCLGLCVGVVVVPLAMLAFVLAGGSRAVYVLGSLPLFLVVDVVGTFVPPALALSTSRISEAIPGGWRVLRGGWKQHMWHVLAPPLAVQVVAAANLRSLDALTQVAVLLPAGIVGILLRGATTAAYLRAVPVSTSGPSWLDGRPHEAAAA